MTQTVASEMDYQAVLADVGESPAAQAQALYALVHAGKAGSEEASHAEAGRGREHTLLAAAVAYCLGYELRAGGAAVDPALLRLAALAHDLGLPEAAQARLPAPVRRWIADRRVFFDALPGSPFPLATFNSPAEQSLYAAHLLASLPLPVPLSQPAPRAFAAHPLGRGQPLAGLALVAADVAIGDYVFEAAGLQQARGAGRLLTRLSRVDMPALFGATFEAPADAARGDEVRAWFRARWDVPPLEAPECVLYGGSSGVLALAPAALADVLPAAIEALYAEQTLTATAVAAARRCDPLELRYGLEPMRFWRLEYEAAQADADLRALIGDERRLEAPLDPTGFPPGKGFGELIAAVELQRQRRRDERAHYPNWETPVYARRCPACDRRPAAAQGPAGEPLCEPCARKAAADAEPVAERGRGADGTASPADTEAIGAASQPRGYVGLIRADVDGVRDYLEQLRAPGDYRAASQRLAAAIEEGVAAALEARDGGVSTADQVIELRGDGVTLLVPGDRALAVASTLGRTFERRFPLPAEGDPWAAHRYRPARGGGAVATPVPSELTLSAGVVVAPASTALPVLHDLAGQLLRSAKRARAQAGRERPDPHRGGACDFLVVNGDGLAATSLADWRAEQTRRSRRDDPELRRFGAPYTWPELEGLLVSARDLARAGLARGEMRRLTESVAQGEAAASVDYLAYRVRAPEPVRAALLRLEEAWRSRGGRTAVAAPWRWVPPGADRRERRETVLADALALAEFCAELRAPEAARAAR